MPRARASATVRAMVAYAASRSRPNASATTVMVVWWLDDELMRVLVR